MNTELNDLIKQNEKLIYSIINEYTNYIDKEDLYQVGVIGIINAYKNFKKEKGVKFSSYAYMYILGEVKKYLRENRTIKINKDTSSLCIKVKKAKSLLEQKLMRTPSTKELCEFLEIDELKLEMALSIQNNVQSLDKPLTNDEGNVDLYEVIPNNEKLDMDELIALKEGFSKLSDEEKILLKHRYFNDRTQSEVAELLGISQVKVSRNEKKVLSKLKSSMIA